MRRVLVSAGDVSGDLILSKVIAHLKELFPEGIEFVGLCGPACQAQGVKPIGESKDVAVVGITEVVRNLPKIFRTLGLLSDQLDSVDSLLCVDFPDFNLKLAKMAHKKKKPVDYIVAPQVWAWRSERVHSMRPLLRRLYPALPFEEEIFREAGIDARFMGHPMRDLLPPRNRRGAREELGLTADDFVIAVLPGSRHSEIRSHASIMMEAWQKLLFYRKKRDLRLPRRWRVLMPLAPGWSEEAFLNCLNSRSQEIFKQLKASGEWITIQDSRQAMMAADFGWICSGTATLEAAYYQLPHILVYKLKWLSAFLIRQLTGYFSDPRNAAGLPNILMGKKFIPEILQDDLSPNRLALETLEYLGNGSRIKDMKLNLRWIPKKLGEAGVSLRIAEDLALLWKNNPKGQGGA